MRTWGLYTLVAKRDRKPHQSLNYRTPAEEHFVL